MKHFNITNDKESDRMSRKTKNIFTCLILVVLIGISIGTIYFAGNSVSIMNSNTNTKQIIPEGNPPSDGDAPPEMEQSDDSISNKEESDSQEESSQNEKHQRPEKNETPPEKPSDDSISENDTKEKRTPPSHKSENDSLESDSSGDRPDKPEKNQSNMISSEQENQSLDLIYCIAFAIEGGFIGIILGYWILSGFHKKNFKEVFSNTDKIVILVLATALVSCGFTYLNGFISKKIAIHQSSIQDNNSVEASGNTTVTGKKTLTSTYQSSNRNESAVLVKDGGSATIENATINKKSGKSTNIESSDFYGVNSGILVQKESSATIKKSKIKTSAKGSNAVFATGENSKITISDSTIETTGSSSSRGLDATYGGEIVADNVTIRTQGDSSATLATDRGEGTVTVSDSTLETNGSGSPLIYSTGNISITDTEGVANDAQMVVVEGKNSATITNSDLSASGVGNRGDVDQAGIMIYQSMSGDASDGEGAFTAINSTLSILDSSSVYQSAPMFFVTNTDAMIHLENTKLSYGSGVLLDIRGTDEWGKSGSNGGSVTFNAKNQSLEGKIKLDNLSSLNLNLTNNSYYQGVINEENNAKEVNITLDKSSKITLMGDSYVTSFEDADESYSNVDFNGFTLYVNGTAVK